MPTSSIEWLVAVGCSIIVGIVLGIAEAEYECKTYGELRIAGRQYECRRIDASH